MRRLLLTTACCVLSVTAAGCTRAETVRVEGAVVELSTTDYRLSPQQLRVAPGRVTFRVTNDDELHHNWVLERNGREKARIPTMPPGETGTVTVRLRRGTYGMTCTVTRHTVLGEHGTIEVR